MDGRSACRTSLRRGRRPARPGRDLAGISSSSWRSELGPGELGPGTLAGIPHLGDATSSSWSSRRAEGDPPAGLGRGAGSPAGGESAHVGARPGPRVRRATGGGVLADPAVRPGTGWRRHWMADELEGVISRLAGNRGAASRRHFLAGRPWRHSRAGVLLMALRRGHAGARGGGGTPSAGGEDETGQLFHWRSTTTRRSSRTSRTSSGAVHGRRWPPRTRRRPSSTSLWTTATYLATLRPRCTSSDGRARPPRGDQSRPDPELRERRRDLPRPATRDPEQALVRDWGLTGVTDDKTLRPARSRTWNDFLAVAEGEAMLEDVGPGHARQPDRHLVLGHRDHD